MPTKRSVVEFVLTHRTKLRYDKEDSKRLKRDHDVYVLKLAGTQFGYTKVSRGSGYRDIDDDLLAKIARQVNLQLAEFKASVRCSFNWPDYAEVLRQKFPTDQEKIPLVPCSIYKFGYRRLSFIRASVLKKCQ